MRGFVHWNYTDFCCFIIIVIVFGWWCHCVVKPGRSLPLHYRQYKTNNLLTAAFGVFIWFILALGHSIPKSAADKIKNSCCEAGNKWKFLRTDWSWYFSLPALSSLALVVRVFFSIAATWHQVWNSLRLFWPFWHETPSLSLTAAGLGAMGKPNNMYFCLHKQGLMCS